MCMIDGAVGVRVCASVGVGNRDSPVPPPRNDARLLAAVQPERIGERVVLICVAVRPAVDRDGENIARGVETTRTDCARKLIADAALDCVERCLEQLSPAGTML